MPSDVAPRKNRATGYYTVALGRGTPGTTSNGRAYLHRCVMAEHIGRQLLPGEVVHHRRSKDENEIGDLLLFASHGDHRRFEALGDRLLARPMQAVRLAA